MKAKVKSTGSVVEGFLDGKGHFDAPIDHDIFDRYDLEEVELLELPVVDMEKEYDHICDAIVIKDHGFNYLKFNIDDERYSAKLDKYPAGAIVQVLIKEK